MRGWLTMLLMLAPSAALAQATDTFSIQIPQCVPGHGYSCPTGTQGVVGNPNCPPPLTMSYLPKNWSCRTRGGWPSDPGYRNALTALYTLQYCEQVVRDIRTVPRGTPVVNAVAGQCNGKPPLDGVPPDLRRTIDGCFQSLHSALDQIVTVNRGTEPSTGANRMPIAEVNERLARAKQSLDSNTGCLKQGVKQLDGYQKTPSTQTAQRTPLLKGGISQNDCVCASETVSAKILPPGSPPGGGYVQTEVYGKILSPSPPTSGGGTKSRPPLQGRVEENVLQGGVEKFTFPDPTQVTGFLGFMEGFMVAWRECVAESFTDDTLDTVIQITYKKIGGKLGRYASTVKLLYDTHGRIEALEAAFERLAEAKSTGGSMDYEDGRLSGLLYCGELDVLDSFEDKAKDFLPPPQSKP